MLLPCLISTSSIQKFEQKPVEYGIWLNRISSDDEQNRCCMYLDLKTKGLEATLVVDEFSGNHTSNDNHGKTTVLEFFCSHKIESFLVNIFLDSIFCIIRKKWL